MKIENKEKNWNC